MGRKSTIEKQTPHTHTQTTEFRAQTESLLRVQTGHTRTESQLNACADRTHTDKQPTVNYGKPE